MRELVDMGRQPPLEGVDPLRRGDEQLERRRRPCTSSTRTVKMCLFLLTARSISRETKPELLLALDSTRMKDCARSMPLMIKSP
ncbi:MAG TPA: hypothetical protein VK984_04875 [Methyloceanibacter sp.]|nr:hypothetical protein [Methyloceanibacter sp.]